MIITNERRDEEKMESLQYCKLLIFIHFQSEDHGNHLLCLIVFLRHWQLSLFPFQDFRLSVHYSNTVVFIYYLTTDGCHKLITPLSRDTKDCFLLIEG